MCWDRFVKNQVGLDTRHLGTGRQSDGQAPANRLDIGGLDTPNIGVSSISQRHELHDVNRIISFIRP